MNLFWTLKQDFIANTIEKNAVSIIAGKKSAIEYTQLKIRNVLIPKDAKTPFFENKKSLLLYNCIISPNLSQKDRGRFYVLFF